MRLATSTSILFERAHGEPIEPSICLKICAEAGYRVMDFCFHDLTTFDSPFLGDDWQEYLSELRVLADSYQIEFSQGHAIVYDFCLENLDHAYYREMMKRCVIGSQLLGIPWLVVHPSTVRDTAWMVRDSKVANLVFFKELSELAKCYHVGIAIENMWDFHLNPLRSYCTSVEELIDLVDSLDSVGICWDAEHGAIMQQNQKKSLKAIGTRLKATHISDYTNGRDIHLLPFLGHVNWEEIMEAFSEIEYSGDFTLEIHRYLTKMPMDAVNQAIKLSYVVGQSLLKDYQELKMRNE